MDYLFTHEHLDRVLPTEEDCEAEPDSFTPTCGQCKFYQARAGRTGYCTAKKQREWIGGDVSRYLHPERDLFDEACDRYVEVIPF